MDQCILAFTADDYSSMGRGPSSAIIKPGPILCQEPDIVSTDNALGNGQLLFYTTGDK